MAREKPTAILVHSVPLPAGAEEPIRVYVNGEERTRGEGVRIEDGVAHFSPPLRARPRLGVGRSTMLALGIGVYGDLKGDTLDIQYQQAGATRLASIPLTP